MTPELTDRLHPFSDEAIARGLPADDVERWLATARPCATLTRAGNGPVVGRQAGMDVQGWESATVHWVIQRDDLAARRFDRAFTGVFWNP